jgi:hypothetical protein
MQHINFAKLVGQEVLLISPVLDKDAPVTVTVRGVDAGGIWIECQSLTDIFLRSTGKTMFEGTPITFVPFWRISLAIVGSDVPAISSEGI